MLTSMLLIAAAQPQVPDPHLRVDQFGYRPLAVKVAVLREPRIGYDAPAPFVPGPAVEVLRVADGSVAWAGTSVAWSGGATHAQSGDGAWWVDFSALQESGAFVVHDPASGRRSAPFEIGTAVYDTALRAALRMFFYQRCGVAKAAPYAEAGWTDGACHVGAEQDTDCRAVGNPSPATSRDLSGGWHDAGDYNKYVNFADQPLHLLLDAYRATPAFSRDDRGIPESGNGVPDILDAARVELDWLRKMQNADGSLLHKVSVTDWSTASPPSADRAPRRYAPPTASATVSGCAVFAHAAYAFGARPDTASQAYARQLEADAVRAWQWLAANPNAIPSSYTNAGFQSAAAEDSAYWQDMNRLSAAVWLYACTGDPTYLAWFDARWQQSNLARWSWASPYEVEFHLPMLAYGDLPGATRSVADAIRRTFAASVSGAAHLGEVAAGIDAYRAPLGDQDYVWGSNATKAGRGLLFVLLNRYGLAPGVARAAIAAAEDYLHYLHGVNPQGFAFLTGMPAAEGAVTEIYHGWFADGTPWDSSRTSPIGPAPGFVPGGANPTYKPDPGYRGPPIAPPQGQPAQKSYRDWNTGWPENSWEVTEPSLSYQAPYVALLGAFAVAPPPRLALSVSPLVAGAAADWTVGGAAAGQLVAIAWALAPGRTRIALPTWPLDLGLALSFAPPGPVLGAGVAGAAGQWTLTVGSLPAAVAGARLWFQASAAGTVVPLHSAVVAR